MIPSCKLSQLGSFVDVLLMAWKSEAARDSGGLTAKGPEKPTDVLEYLN